MNSIILRRGGFVRSCRSSEASVQRIDGAYVYELGAKLRPILSLPEEETEKIRVHHVIGPAIDAVEGFLFESVYITHARTVHASATSLLDALRKMKIDFTKFDTLNDKISEWSVKGVKDKFKSFEAILLAELQGFHFI